MPFLDYFRNIFGRRSPSEPNDGSIVDPHSNKFRNPVWQVDDDDDDVDDFRRPGGIMHFSIFTDPMEMTRYFEAQMDSMMKEFFHGFGNNSDFFSSLPDNPPMNALPFKPEKEKSLRDTFLKGDSGLEYREDKIDRDLDGKISPSDFSDMWQNTNVTKEVQPYIQQQTFGKSVRKEVYRRPDGSVEHKQIIKDSNGNEETIISREIGDKKYIITTKKDKDGVETKTEDLINMNESEIKMFTDKWPSTQNDSTSHSTILNSFPWEKLFGPTPKL